MKDVYTTDLDMLFLCEQGTIREIVQTFLYTKCYL